MKTFYFICAFLLICSSVVALEGPSEEEYLVYSDLLSQMEYSRVPTIFVVSDRTNNQHLMDENSVKYYEENSMFTTSGLFNLKLDEVLVEDYNTKNAEEHELGNKFSTLQEVILLSEERMDEIFWGSGGGWSEFYSLYPGSTGTVDFSRVGFNKDKTQALVYFGNQSYYTAGAGYYIMLSKEEEEWKIVDRVMVWIS